MNTWRDFIVPGEWCGIQIGIDLREEQNRSGQGIKTINKLDLLGVIWLWDVKGIILAPWILIKNHRAPRGFCYITRNKIIMFTWRIMQKRDLFLRKIIIIIFYGCFFFFWSLTAELKSHGSSSKYGNWSLKRLTFISCLFFSIGPHFLKCILRLLTKTISFFINNECFEDRIYPCKIRTVRDEMDCSHLLGL